MLTHSRRNTDKTTSSRRRTTRSKSRTNYAFIDSNNVYVSVRNQGWSIDYSKFRKYLKDKHNVSKAFIFIGYIEGSEAIYDSLKEAGFEIIYRPTIEYKVDGETMTKGNVDVELVLKIMTEINNYSKAVVVSGDGDFYAVIKYLKDNNKLRNIIIPDKKKFSVLLKEFENDMLSLTDLQKELQENKKPPRKKKKK